VVVLRWERYLSPSVALVVACRVTRLWVVISTVWGVPKVFPSVAVQAQITVHSLPKRCDCSVHPHWRTPRPLPRQAV
jgi:hypothetical protein